MLPALGGGSDVSGSAIVRGYWKKQNASPEFEAWWRKTLNDGFIEGSAYTPKSVSLKLLSFPAAAAPAANNDANSLEINLRRDPSVYDGQFANNGWLQELPKPMSKLTWHNAVLMGPKMADRAGIRAMDE